MASLFMQAALPPGVPNPLRTRPNYLKLQQPASLFSYKDENKMQFFGSVLANFFRHWVIKNQCWVG